MKYYPLSNLLANLQKLAEINVEDDNLVLASMTEDQEVLELISTASVQCAAIMKNAADKLQSKLTEALYTDSEYLEHLSAVATEFDASGDEYLQKQAEILDHTLMVLASEDFQKYRSEAIHDAYTKCKVDKDKELNVDQLKKSYQENVKPAKISSAPLSVRTCPDHPGAQMMRVADGIFQCDMDKKVYNYHDGFKTLKGDVVPGGDVSLQTDMYKQLPDMHYSFDTRENKLNS